MDIILLVIGGINTSNQNHYPSCHSIKRHGIHCACRCAAPIAHIRRELRSLGSSRVRPTQSLPRGQSPDRLSLRRHPSAGEVDGERESRARSAWQQWGHVLKDCEPSVQSEVLARREHFKL